MCVCGGGGGGVHRRILSFGRGVTPKFGVDVEGVHNTYQLGRSGHMLPQNTKKNEKML